MTIDAHFAAIEGNGPHHVLVLHGWALDSGVWLGTRAKSNVMDFTWAYLDFPGYGASRHSQPADGVDGMAASALSAVDELGWTSFSVVGHSMGGVTALRVATLRPEAISRVVALTPVSPGGTPLDEATYAAFANAWDDPGAAIRSNLAPGIEADDLDRLVARNRATMDRPTWEAYLKNWTSADFMGDLSRIQSPVAILYGETDPFITADYLKPTLDHLPDGRLVKLPSVGHYPMIEATAEAQEAIEKALRA